MEPFSQQKTLDMERGLFLIKYKSSESTDYPPTVSLVAEQGSEEFGRIDLAAGCRRGRLVVARRQLGREGNTKGPRQRHGHGGEPNGSMAARVQVLPLSVDPGGAKERELAAAQLDLSNFRVLGHVAGRGDVIVDADNWIGGPLAPSRIEGIAIQWPGKPQDLILRYAVTVGGPRPIMGQFVEAGGFAGTRGRALPVVGATLEIEGPNAARHQLVIESIFLGSPQSKIVGRRVVLAGPTGREPLVGLRIRIESADQPIPVRQVSQAPRLAHVEHARQDGNGRDSQPTRKFIVPAVVEPDSEVPPSSPRTPGAKRAGRVRVFRSSARGRQLQPGP